MRTKTSPWILLAALSLFPLAACSDDGSGDTEMDETTTGDTDDTDDTAGDGDGDPAGDEIDEAAVIAMAQGYASWTQVNAMTFPSQHGGGTAMVNVWVPNDLVDQYKAIDPDNPAATSFAEGSMIVKEHVDEMGNYVMGTVMYKGPADYGESGGWWWGMGDVAGGALEATGQVEGCIGCHMGYPDTDWVIGVPADNQAP